MSTVGKLDIRLVVGVLFILLGAMLVIYGLATGPSERSLGINIDLYWGIVMAVFGVIMWGLARRGNRHAARS